VRGIVATQLLRASLLFGVVGCGELLHPPAAVLLVLLAGLGATFPIPTVGFRSLVPVAVPRRLWNQANAADSVTFDTAFIIGPALAGATVSLVGAPWAIGMQGVATLVAGAVASRVREPRGRVIETEPPLEAVVAARGPGSFTGLRVGLSLAAGLAYARHLPLYLLDSLPLLARRSLPDPAPYAIRDAGHAEVYAWQEGEGVRRLAVQALPGWLPASGRIVVEPAGKLALWSPVHAGLEIPADQRSPASRALGDGANEALDSQKPVRYDEVKALYVQPAAAEERKRKAPP